MSRHFTGRDMLLVMVGFFGLVIGVNFTMAFFASDSFGGTVVENSYVASQKYNGWLQAARSQRALPWRAEQVLAADRHVLLRVTGDGSFAATGTAQHPLGRAGDVPLSFVAGADGTLRSTTPLPPGRWQVRISVQRGSEVMRLAGTLQ
jgi:nitrogen fixation protein FixH